VMVKQEADRLGIVVTEADVKALYDQWDTKLRRDSNGERTLKETIREQNTTEREFIEQIWHLLRKERIAEHPQYLGKSLPKHEHTRLRQIGIVIGKVREKTDVKYGIWIVDHTEARTRPDKLPAGVVATVNGTPITMLEWGRALVLRLPGHQVREYLDTECKTALMNAEGIRISDEDLDKELEHLEQLWPLERELQREEIWRTVAFKDRVESQFNMSLEDIKKSRYTRGLLGLVVRMRADVTEAKVLEDFEKNKDGLYGSHLLVSDIQISFAQKEGLMAGTGVRTRREALEMAHRILRQHATGVPFEKIMADVNNRRDPTVRGRRIRLYKTQGDQLVYTEAARIQDGDVTTPFETLSEVHVMRREGVRPARTLEEVRPYVREVIARREARAWIDERVKDPKYVRVTWPLPERGAIGK
jgi:hypothetical protein